MEDLLDINVERNFHDITYIININANTEMLTIDVESKQSGDSWIANFQASYIEEITSKTGNYKKYPTFLKMLQSAIKNQTDTVYIDILTFQDLEQIKNKRPKQNQQQNLVPNNKRYLILSYIVEFDKVHYPLPLNFNEQPNIQQMKNTIIRLRKENEQQAKQLTTLLESKKNEVNPLEVINEQNKEIEFLKNLLEQKDRDILELKNIVHQQSSTTVNKQEYIELRSKYLQSENTNAEITKKVIELEDCLQQIIDENHLLKNQDKKNKQRITSLEQELQQTLTRSKTKLQPNISRSPSTSKSSNQFKVSSSINKVLSKKKSAEKTTPIRIRKESFDSDTESSYRRKSNSKRTDQSPSARSNSSRKTSQKLKQSNSNLFKKQKQTTTNESRKFEDPEEQRLLKRLRDLREKNKENTIVTTPSNKMEASCEDLHSIDERLNKLNNLLQRAKNQ
ncbi:unnamed protein product (macronuclear) [Paramecium tetraurelia]|uniref:Spindle assembly abnormal protein 6 N-terminal domain-containing protein n=1 Tax=Paramecium tetraurelia TaxID=5888 RepID=A0DLK2_PARTE|nr:uncharacterized protein GSPATT00018236001 [Paramecium tetraurelia]CAK83919.1 unnamed protein product [Paramecium tetraurelia]|eukprot:XP_001451316.1 hypothetical protein (macronuclear) [Paramecium tetraurelia strain d4-2]